MKDKSDMIHPECGTAALGCGCDSTQPRAAVPHTDPPPPSKIGIRLDNHTFRSASARGVTLLEVMLATAILGVALISLAVAVGSCIRGFSAADQVQVALNLTEDQLERWQASLASETEVKIGTTEGEKTINQRNFSWTHEITATEEPDLLLSTFTVKWQQGGSEQQRTFVSLVPKAIKR